jgi:hypothetical protein
MFGLDFFCLLKDAKLAKSSAKGQKYNNIRYFVLFPSLHNGFIKKLPDQSGFVPRENVICELF